MSRPARGVVRMVDGKLHLEVPDVGLLPIGSKARQASSVPDLEDGDEVVALVDGYAQLSVRRIERRVGVPVRTVPAPAAKPSPSTKATVPDVAGLVNPYTFLPYVPGPPGDRHRLPEHRTRPASADLVSGQIRLELGIRSPLAIFGRSTNEPATHATREGGFPLLSDKQRAELLDKGKTHTHVALRRDERGLPVVPGSSLKGVARLWFEAITSSVRLPDESPVSWRAVAISGNRRIGELRKRGVDRSKARDNRMRLQPEPGWEIVEVAQWSPGVSSAPASAPEFSAPASSLESTIPTSSPESSAPASVSDSISRASSAEEVSVRLKARIEAVLDAWNVPTDSAGRPLLVDGEGIVGKEDGSSGRLKVGVSQSGRKVGDSEVTPPDVSVQVVHPGSSGSYFPLDVRTIETWKWAHRHQESGMGRAAGSAQQEGELAVGDRTVVFRRLSPWDLRDGDLVWFEDERDRVTFFGRLRNDRWADLDPVAKRVPKGHGPGPSPDRLSSVSIVFGTTGERKAGGGSEEAWAGRVRFGAGRWLSEGDEQVATYTLRPLQTPKLSAAGFYLRPGGAKSDSTSWAPGQDVLAGSKVYWHTISDSPPRNDRHVQLAIDPNGHPARTVQNATVEAATAGRFGLTIWFEDLTAAELGALLVACSLRFTEQESVRGWKLGIGKPLGLGSVVNRIDEVTIYGPERLRDPTSSFGGRTLPGDSAEVRDYERNALAYFVPHAATLETFDFIARLDSMAGRRVEYPPLGTLRALPDGSRQAQPDAAAVGRGAALRLSQRNDRA